MIESNLAPEPKKRSPPYLVASECIHRHVFCARGVALVVTCASPRVTRAMVIFALEPGNQSTMPFASRFALASVYSVPHLNYRSGQDGTPHAISVSSGRTKLIV